MLQRKMTPNWGIYNLLSYGYAKYGDECKLLSLQKEMAERGILMEEMTTNDLVMDKFVAQI